MFDSPRLLSWVLTLLQSCKSNLSQQPRRNLVMICSFSSMMEHHVTKKEC